MMRYAFRIIITLMCLYIFIAKTFAVFCFFSRQKCDYPILVADLVVLYACVLLVLFLWGKNKNIKYALMWNLLLIGAVIMETYSGLFNYLTKNQMINQNIALWIYDIPNSLSVFLLVITMTKMRSLRMNSPQYKQKKPSRRM